MKRIILVLCLFSIALPMLAYSQVLGEPEPVRFSALMARTQVGVGFQREWVTRSGEESVPKASWVGVVPASFNLTPSTDAIGQLAYNFTSRSTRLVLGVRFVLIGRK